MEETQNNERDY